MPFEVVPVVTVRCLVLVVEPSVLTSTVVVPSVAVVTASEGTCTTSPVALVTILAVTVAPTKNWSAGAVKVTVTGKVATPELASATAPTSVTVPVAVAPAAPVALVRDVPVPDAEVDEPDPEPVGAAAEPAPGKAPPPKPRIPPADDDVEVDTVSVTDWPMATLATSALLTARSTW